MSTAFQEIITRLRQGAFDTNDLEVLLDLLRTNKHLYNRFTDIHNELLRSSEYNINLLRLAVGDFRVYYVLTKHARVIKEFKSLVKALAVNIVAYAYKPVIRAQTAASTLLIPHKYTSLYNPLVIAYLHRYHHEYYLRNIYTPIETKTTLYAVNPSIINTYLFRDLLIFTSMVYEPMIAGKLYVDTSAHTSIIEVFKDWRPKISEMEVSRIINAYLEILSSQLSIIRAIIKSLNYMYEDTARISSISSRKTITSTVLEWYTEAGHKVLNTAYISARNTLLGYTGSIYPPLLNTITTGLSILLDRKNIVSENIFRIIETVMETYYYEDTLLETEIPDTPGSPSIRDSLDAVKEIRSVLENKLVLNQDIVRETISRDIEPYITLREKLREISSRRGRLVWLGVELG